MSVLIKGKMPEKCFQCVAYDIGSTSCLLFSNGIPARYSLSAREKPDWCELVELPPHGRLIDADALYRTIDATSERTIGHTTFKETVLLDIRGMPTILESTMGQVNSEKAINEAEREE